MKHSDSPSQSRLISQYLIIALSILVGLLCLGGFTFTSIYWDINSTIENNCQENQTNNAILCYIRSLISEARRTQWNRFILSSLLLTYASVFFHIIIESNRSNITGLLGQMIFHTISITIGLGISYPVFYLPSYIYFYQLKHNSIKSPVPIAMLVIGLIYSICMIILPTYLIHFFSSNELLMTIMSIVLLGSPIAFTFVSFPFRLISGRLQRCWLVNSHRLILYCQIILFIFSSPIYFITLVAFIQHCSVHLLQESYLFNHLSNRINPIPMVWSIDYTFLLVALGLFISINEYMFNEKKKKKKKNRRRMNRSHFAQIRTVIGYLIFAVAFLIAPCLVFPLYIAWKEYQYLKLM